MMNDRFRQDIKVGVCLSLGFFGGNLIKSFYKNGHITEYNFLDACAYGYTILLPLLALSFWRNK
jgi:hypothetical protein